MSSIKTLTILFLFLSFIQTAYCQVFDLASNIVLASGNDDRVYPGETVSFNVTVFNQGNITAENIDVTLMIPVGLTSVTGIANLGTITFTGPIAPGAMEMQTLEFTVDNNITNSAMLIIKNEISSAEDDAGANPMDVDSTPDADFMNDVVINDVIDNTGGDEDDSDIEAIYVEIFDLALVKTLAQGEDNRVYPGDQVSFSLEIYNQGTVSASNIIIKEYAAAGLTIMGASSNTIFGPIAPGSSVTINVTYDVSSTTVQTIESITEIQSYEDDLGESPEDIDSFADNVSSNDVTINDSIDNEGGDEDDSDVEFVFVEIFDLASNIILAPGEDDIVYPAEIVSFKVTVFNQGTVSAENIDVTLMIPFGLTSVSGIANLGTITFAGPIAPGDSQFQILEFEVGNTITSPIELIVKEEISSALDDLGENAPDIDSTPDADFTNDAGGVVDSPSDDTINNEGGDEDDSDPENVFVEVIPVLVDFTNIDYPVLENLNQATVCLQLSTVPTSDISAEVSYTGGAAQAGADYIGTPAIQQIVFPANSNSEQCFTVGLIDDNLIEMNETIEFEIINVSSTEPSGIGAIKTTSITILDNDDNDNDNVENSVDNCPNNFNPFQEDLDGDSIGDACDDSNVVTNLAEFEDHIYVNKPSSGVVLKSLDGQCWIMVIGNDGNLNIVSVECPN